MTWCAKCGREVCTPCFIAANDNEPARVIKVASDAELRRGERVTTMALALIALDLPRRQIPNWLSDVLYQPGIYPIWSDGTPFEIPEIDDLFGEDGSWRWLGYLMEFAHRPPKQRPQERVLQRYRIIDLAIRLSAANDND